MRDIPGDDLAVALSEVARSLQTEPDERHTLDAITTTAVDTVPGSRYAGLMVVEHHRDVDTRAATDEVVRQIDQAQYDTGQGPCLQAIYDDRMVKVADMAGEDRWPVFAARAAELGVRSMLSFQLYVEDDTLGALNLYSCEPGAFGDEAEHVGRLFAAHAAVALSGAKQQEQCGHTIEVRDLIGQAKGILMERYSADADQAFRLLIQVSQRTGTKLIDVVRHLTATRELRPDRRPPGTC
ncbi:GAF domain-containing protein [Actinoplanes octamycinicus]|uniref:GAF domain-containing protein n=1 Tax=Actinoplanes octamycinicus TaxID=135948 RepID=A0A7W7H0M0_9ACTN|nr:GAF and ANTAR domain-containing protein [Actinoplanes octamycinicus]MBB4741743.1 GAF domain-containing protein [Actinoplanes octamycinicus]GIE57296.1 transcriptional regulator [Actinoplanes octamycinicus]